MTTYLVLRQPSEIGSSYVSYTAEDLEYAGVTFSWCVAGMGFRWTSQAACHTDLNSSLLMSPFGSGLSSKASELVFPHV